MDIEVNGPIGREVLSELDARIAASNAPGSTGKPALGSVVCSACVSVVEWGYASYIRDRDTNTPISPYFPSLAELFPWMHAHGWTWDTAAGPWAVRRD